MIKWNTDTDSFELGQWFHGRIYERRCDLSPDGSKLIYFANKFTSRTLSDPEYTYAWTAISKPPYFTALALWPKGDCWHGGGLFEDNRTVWLNHKPDAAKPHPEHRPKGLKIVPNPEAYGEDGPVYYRRLKRDGWVLKQEGSFNYAKGGWKTEAAEIWEKTRPSDGARLVTELVEINSKKAGGPYIEEFTVFRNNTRIPVGRAEWADWDQNGRLVVARDGKLIEVHINKGEMVLRELADFNNSKPEPKAAPASARRW